MYRRTVDETMKSTPVQGKLTSSANDDGWSWKTDDGRIVKINGYSISGDITEWSDGDDYGLVPGPKDDRAFNEEAPVLDEHHWYECRVALLLDYRIVAHLEISTRDPRRAYGWLENAIVCMQMHAMSTMD